MRKNLNEYKKDEKILDFFVVKSKNLRTSNKGDQYLDLVIADNSGEMAAKIWDTTREDTSQANELEGREVVKIQGIVTEWNGVKQLKIIKLRKAREEDNVDISALVRTSPISGEDLYKIIHEKAESIADDDFKKITLLLMDRNQERLTYFPAAAKNHHAEKGGLLYHVHRMLMGAERMCEVYPLLSKDLLMCGVILHDIAKLEEIDADELGMAEKYTLEGQMLGHIVQGIKMIDSAGTELSIPAEKRIMLEHMILSHHYEPEFGSPKKPMFPEAEMLHYLDIIDARIYDMEKALSGVEAGDFSEKIWSMDNRKMYKPSYEE